MPVKIIKLNQRQHMSWQPVKFYILTDELVDCVVIEAGLLRYCISSKPRFVVMILQLNQKSFCHRNFFHRLVPDRLSQLYDTTQLLETVFKQYSNRIFVFEGLTCINYLKYTYLK